MIRECRILDCQVVLHACCDPLTRRCDAFLQGIYDKYRSVISDNPSLFKPLENPADSPFSTRLTSEGDADFEAWIVSHSDVHRYMDAAELTRQVGDPAKIPEEDRKKRALMTVLYSMAHVHDKESLDDFQRSMCSRNHQQDSVVVTRRSDNRGSNAASSKWSVIQDIQLFRGAAWELLHVASFRLSYAMYVRTRSDGRSSPEVTTCNHLLYSVMRCRRTTHHRPTVLPHPAARL